MKSAPGRGSRGVGATGTACVRHVDPQRVGRWTRTGSDTHAERLPSARGSCDGVLGGRPADEALYRQCFACGVRTFLACRDDAGPRSQGAPGVGGAGTFHAEQRSLLRRHRFMIGALTAVVLFAPVWISLGRALGDPSLGSTTSARVAEWSRDHGAGGLITWVENIYYSHHAPPVGGKPAANAIPARPVHPVTTGVSASARVRAGALPVPAPLTPFPANPLPEEGRWVPAGRLVHGLPAVYTTFMRPDAVHTSVVDGVAWIDTKLLSVRLYSGGYIPGGGPFKYATPLHRPAETTLVAAFNGGFRLDDSQAGYYTDGVMVRPLVKGAASLVIYKNGTATVGAWGSGLTMTPQVLSVRQELRLLVDNADGAGPGRQRGRPVGKGDRQLGLRVPFRSRRDQRWCPRLRRWSQA